MIPAPVSFILVPLLILLFLWICLGAVILRAAIAAANKIVNKGVNKGTNENTSNALVENTDLPSSDSQDSVNPYRPPAHTAAEAPSVPSTIPEPNLAFSFGISLLVTLVGCLLNFGLAVAISGAPLPLAAGFILGLTITFVVSSLILSKMLPTTLGRSALVLSFYGLIGFAFITVVACITTLIVVTGS